MQRRVNRLRVAGNPGVLDSFSLLAQGVDVFCRQVFKFSVGFILRGLVQNEIFEELKVLLAQTLVSEMGVFR